jgi:hypothetical protein
MAIGGGILPKIWIWALEKGGKTRDRSKVLETRTVRDNSRH